MAKPKKTKNMYRPGEASAEQASRLSGKPRRQKGVQRVTNLDGSVARRDQKDTYINDNESKLNHRHERAVFVAASNQNIGSW
jgi:hypothetical protein